jgi:hypothetical protein
MTNFQKLAQECNESQELPYELAVSLGDDGDAANRAVLTKCHKTFCHDVMPDFFERERVSPSQELQGDFA